MPKGKWKKRLRFEVSWDAGRQAWKVSGPRGCGGPPGWYNTKSLAVSLAAVIAREAQPSELVIKGRNNRIQDTRTYGHDPRKTKG